MAHFKKPAPGQDLSQTSLAASLARDRDASLAGELDLGFDVDPDLMTKPGQASLRRPKRKGRSMPVVLLLTLVAAGAWLFGALDRFGVPPPPRAVTDLVRGIGKSGAEPAPPAPAVAPKKRHH